MPNALTPCSKSTISQFQSTKKVNFPLAPVKRVMSLRDASKKMSKSEPSDFSRINLSDQPEVLFDKIKKSKTDSFETVKAL